MSQNDLKHAFAEARYMVVFVSILGQKDAEYERLDEDLLRKVEQVEGFMGWQSVRDAERRGIMISYWQGIEAIDQWRQDEQHRYAKSEAQHRWYQHWTSYICEIKHCNYSPEV